VSERLLISRGDTSSFGVPCETRDKNYVDIAFLDAYATKQWETILHFLVGTEMPEEPGGGVLQLLRQSRLMEGDPLYFNHLTVGLNLQQTEKYENHSFWLCFFIARCQCTDMDFITSVLGTFYDFEYGSG
jgi:Transcription factor Tfb2